MGTLLIFICSIIFTFTIFSAFLLFGSYISLLKSKSGSYAYSLSNIFNCAIAILLLTLLYPITLIINVYEIFRLWYRGAIRTLSVSLNAFSALGLAIIFPLLILA